MRNENVWAHNHLYMNVQSSTIHNSQNVETTQMSTKWWMDKQNKVQSTTEYYSAMKRSEVLLHAITEMNL